MSMLEARERHVGKLNVDVWGSWGLRPCTRLPEENVFKAEKVWEGSKRV